MMTPAQAFVNPFTDPQCEILSDDEIERQCSESALDPGLERSVLPRKGKKICKPEICDNTNLRSINEMTLKEQDTFWKMIGTIRGLVVVAERSSCHSHSRLLQHLALF